VIPKPLSRGEEDFMLHCLADKLPAPDREHRFLEGRKFRFDFAWPKFKIAVEIEGGTRQNGRHQRHDGFTADCRKYNLASLHGWKVFRFTSEQVKSGEAIDTMLTMMRSIGAM